MTRDVKQGLGRAAAGARDDRQRAAGGWATAVALTERWLVRAERADVLLEGLAPEMPARERARAQRLVLGVIRWASRLEGTLAGLMPRAPRPRVRALLLVTGFEILEGGPEAAKIVHHAVGQAKILTSPAEARAVNAVARRMAARLAEKPVDLAAGFAHPPWLVQRWIGLFTEPVTRKLLEWNQQPAPVYARWRRAAPVPDFLGPTPWPDFFAVKPGHWEEVRTLAQEGALYLQDPSTRLGVEALAPQPGEAILDACAAPGGKSLFLADALVAAAGRAGGMPGASPLATVVAMDKPARPGRPDPRLRRLRENLARAPEAVRVAMVEADLRTVTARFLNDLNLPVAFDAILLDAPCSNTGVMRHRVDVKWRLRPADFARHAGQQFELLRAAARLAKPAGRVVYSTCSLDREENEGVVERFLRATPGWRLEREVRAFPWIDGHDGAGVFRLVSK